MPLNCFCDVACLASRSQWELPLDMIHFVADESKNLTAPRRTGAAGERAKRSHVAKTVRRREREEYTAGNNLG